SPSSSTAAKASSLSAIAALPSSLVGIRRLLLELLPEVLGLVRPALVHAPLGILPRLMGEIALDRGAVGLYPLQTLGVALVWHVHTAGYVAQRTAALNPRAELTINPLDDRSTTRGRSPQPRGAWRAALLAALRAV